MRNNSILSVVLLIRRLVEVLILGMTVSDHSLVIVLAEQINIQQMLTYTYWDFDSCGRILDTNHYQMTATEKYGCNFYNEDTMLTAYNKSLNFSTPILPEEIMGCNFLSFLTNSKDVHLNCKQFQKPDFHNKVITATAVDDPENTYMLRYSTDASGNLEFSGGCSFRIVKDLEFFLNFTLKSTVSQNYIYEIEGNHTLGGIGQQLIVGSADISIPLAYFLPYRNKYLTNLHPIIKEPIFAVFVQPHSTSARDVYINPFSKPLWTSIITLWLVIGVFVPIFVYLLRLPTQPHIVKNNNYRNQEYWMMIFAAICQQGWYKTYKSISIRALTFVAFLYGFVIFVSYCAVIISTLSVKVIPIKTFDELLYDGFIILTDPIFQWGRYFGQEGKSEFEVLNEITQNYVDDPTSVEQSLNGGHAFLTTLDYFIPIAQNQSRSDMFLCDAVATVLAKGMSSYSGFYVNKSSPLRKPFNYGLDFMLERGLIKRHYNTYLSETVLKCLVSGFQKEFRVTQLHFWDLLTAFVSLVAGILSSLFVILMESLAYRNNFKLKNYWPF